MVSRQSNFVIGSTVIANYFGLLMHLETSSNLYWVTVNPYNTDLTSGGSSGGEGALIGLRGSCLGLGSDIGIFTSPRCPMYLFHKI